MIRIVLVFIALTAGSVAGWLALTAQQPAPAPASAPARIVEEPTVEVLVASADVRQGDPLGEANLQWRRWPQSGVTSKFILRNVQPDALQQMSGQVARRDILAQEPVTPEKLIVAAANPLSLALSDGKRAVGVRITAETTAGGFILPHDRVDVLHTTLINGANGERQATTTTILHNVQVLAIDQSFQAEAGGKGKAAIGRTATLELSPEQSERLVAAESSGSISLVLRPVNDMSVPAPRQRQAPAPAAVQTQETIRITRGTDVEIVRRPAPASARAPAGTAQP